MRFLWRLPGRFGIAIELARQSRTIKFTVKKQTGSTQPAEWCICLGLGLITLAVFWPSFSHAFLGFDDQQYVTENPQVRAGLTWGGLRWAFTTFYASNWHPLTWLSHMLDWQIYGPKPAGHHLTNILLHAANAALLFLIMNRMTRATWRSACVAALFAWHPLHVESVAWIAERKDVLSTFFFLLTLMAYASYVRKTEKGATVSYLLSLLFFVLALMSKPMVVTLPLVLLLLDYWPLRRFQNAGLPRILLEKLPFLLLSAVGCALTVIAQKQALTIVSVAGLPLSQRIPHVLVAYVHYLGATFLPWHLAAYYPYVRHFPAIIVAGASVVLALISFLALRFARARPYLPVGWFWYLGTLLPVIGLIQVGDQAWADRYTYIALIGIFIVVVWGVADMVPRYFPRPASARMILVTFSSAVCIALVAGTVLQLRYWRDTRSLFKHALAVTEGNDRAATVLGSLADEEGNLDEAKRFYALALSYNANNPETHFHLGKLLDKQGKLDDALLQYQQSLWAGQWQERAHLAMGIDLARQTNFDQAIVHYQAVLAINPKSALAQNNLARVLHILGRKDEAISHYEAAIRLSPQLTQAHNNLGVLLLQEGRLAEGTSQLQEAARLNPMDGETQYNLAMALNQQGRWSEAADIFSRLAPALPNDARLYCEYGRALAHLGKTREALSRYAHALLLQPNSPEALQRLAWLLSTAPNSEYRNGREALNMALLACQLTASKEPAPLMTLAAAYAETGQFDDAIRSAQVAESLARLNGKKESAEKCGRMLDEFKAGKPWREEAGMMADETAKPK